MNVVHKQQRFILNILHTLHTWCTLRILYFASQDTGYLLETSDNVLTYTMRNGLDVESTLGYFIAFAELSEGTPPVFWTMKATIGDGEVMFEEDGVFTGDCDASGSSDSGVSRLIWGDLVEYHDNGCEENFR